VGGLSAAMLVTYRDLLAAELNVKAVELLDAAPRHDVVLDYAKLGKRLRAKVKAVAAAVATGDYRANADGSVEVAGETLARDEVTWRAVAASESGFAARDGLVVALDLAVDDVLSREATARELARAVQDLRKRAGLRYGEPVRLAVVGDSAELDGVLAEHGRWLAAQCCAAEVGRVALDDPASETRVELGAATIDVSLARSRP
jgi:uncharacterized protein DUF5915